MQALKISYKHHRFPPQIIAHVGWLYVRFNLNLREIEEMVLAHSVDVSYEPIRRWTVKFGPLIAHVLRRRLPRPGDVWHLDGCCHVNGREVDGSLLNRDRSALPRSP